MDSNITTVQQISTRLQANSPYQSTKPALKQAININQDLIDPRANTVHCTPTPAITPAWSESLFTVYPLLVEPCPHSSPHFHF